MDGQDIQFDSMGISGKHTTKVMADKKDANMQNNAQLAPHGAHEIVDKKG